jgi:ferredoxin-NADP reductase
MPQILRCHVTDILDHGKHVYSIILKPVNLVPFFLPGQFLHLALDKVTRADEWPDSRPFSIASPPAERQNLRITYAVKGLFTQRMEAELHPGREIWVNMPFGAFIVNDDTDVCLLAGGTGVTAFTGFLAGLRAKHPHHVYLFYGAGSPHLLIYRPLVEDAQQRCPNLQVRFLAEQDTEGTGCLLGRIEAATVFEMIPNPLSVIYYLAGPPGMISSLSSGLSQRGVTESNLVADAWE